jgi:hypothetical protein
MDQIMRGLVEEEKMTKEQRATYLDALTQQLIGRLSGARTAGRIGGGREAGGIGTFPAARGVV